MSLVKLYHEQLQDNNKTISSMYDNIMDVDLHGGDNILIKPPEVEQIHFDCLRKVR